MTLDPNNKGYFAAFKAKDARFDGKLFIGVLTTGVYCRPICRAKLPKEENCVYFGSAAEAEEAGYRPCLLCRPEIAPGSSGAEAMTNLAYRARRLFDENYAAGLTLTEVAKRLGYTKRHISRAFIAEFKVTPHNYSRSCRLLLAKNLLTDSNLKIIDVAMTVGFGSLRRFNDVFKARYKLTPKNLRGRTKEANNSESPEITLTLGYRPPYLWAALLKFLKARAIAGVEVVKNNEYARTVRLETEDHKQIFGWLRVGHQPKNNSLSLTISESLWPVLPRVLAKVRHLFDVNSDPLAIFETLAIMNEIRPGLCVLGTRLPGSFNAFETSVRAILGQQVSVQAARVLASRLAATFGEEAQTPIEGLTRTFPAPTDILSLGEAITDRLGSLGVISSRSQTIYELALALSSGKIDLETPGRPLEEIEKLLAIRGIGPWTANYIAMRVMGWPDVFLPTDVGVKNALKPYEAKDLAKMAESWRPFRSYATMSLWNSL